MWFYVQEPTGGFRAHTTPPVRLSNITAPVRLSNITSLLPPTIPPHPELIRNQQKTVRCIKERRIKINRLRYTSHTMTAFKNYVHVDDGGKVLRVSVEEEDGRGARSVLVTQLFNMKAAQQFPAHNYANSAS
jgi:hypothetical protein